MVSFELGKEIEEDVFVLSQQRKNSDLSPHVESNLRSWDSGVWCSISEPQRLYSEWGLLQSSVTLVLHTARISNVVNIMFVNRIWLRIFSLSYTRDKMKTSFFISLLSSKLTIPHSIYKHDAMQDTMQDACHMNFVIDLTHCGVSLAQW